MPQYSYTARAKDGTHAAALMEAPNERTVTDALRAQGMIPTSIKENRKKVTFSSLLNSVSKVKLIDKITFIKNLSVMVKAGLPVSKSMTILASQTTNKKFANVVSEVARAVESGTSLAEALAKYPNIFSNIFVSMVRVGEVSGNLEQDMKYLSDQLQRDYNLISKTKGAMTYPLVVLVALMLVGFVMFTFVLPKLTSTFKEFDIQLPLMTRVVIGLVDLFSKYGLISIPLFVLAIFGFMYWRKTEQGKKIVHKVVLYLPVFGPIVKKVNLARFVGVFASLLKSGMPIVDALGVSSDVVGNIYYKQVISEAASKVKLGSPLAARFKQHPDMFSPLVIQMMEVGEESGTTEAVLTEVASFYEAEVDQTMKNLSSILEPVLMLVIGSVVGVLAIALIAPIYSITQNVQ